MLLQKLTIVRKKESFVELELKALTESQPMKKKNVFGKNSKKIWEKPKKDLRVDHNSVMKKDRQISRPFKMVFLSSEIWFQFSKNVLDTRQVRKIAI